MTHEEIAVQMQTRGFDVTPEEVQEFAERGSLPPSVISDAYDARREELLLEFLDIDTTPIDSDHPRRIR